MITGANRGEQGVCAAGSLSTSSPSSPSSLSSLSLFFFFFFSWSVTWTT